MKAGSLTPLFEPSSIAVVGASRDPGKLGYTLLKNVVDYGFRGAIYPVNPSGGAVLDREIHPSVGAIGKPVDLALVSIPNRAVPSVIRDLAAAGTKAVVILSSGFGEMATGGGDLQRSIDEVRRQSGMRILGPNCMGIYNIHHAMNATYFWELPRNAGNVSFISQSGAYGGILFKELKKRRMGIAKFVSIGNQVDMTHADLLEHLQDDPKTGVIAMFVEELKDGRRFLEAASAVSRRKPIVLFKAGRTASGGRAAASHTGSMAGDVTVFRAAMREAGIHLAERTDDFIDLIAAFSSYPNLVPARESVGILTISGGPCVAASDACEESGLSVPRLSDVKRAEIRTMIPEFGADGNPVDMTPQMDPAKFADCIETIVKDPALGMIMAINVGLDRQGFADGFTRSKARYRKPIVAFVVDNPIIEGEFERHGIPNFPAPERAVTALRALADRRSSSGRAWRRGKEKTHDGHPLVRRAAVAGVRHLTEPVAKGILTNYGIAIPSGKTIVGRKDAERVARNLGYPLVAKTAREGVVHKTDAGGVIVGIHDIRELRKALMSLCRRFGKDSPILIEKMIPGDLELIVGGRRDPCFGPVVILGIGGIYTEVVRDFAVRLCPVGATAARDMADDLKMGKLLDGFRGMTGIDRKIISETIRCVSRLMMENPSIEELDVNPMKSHRGALIALDARIILRMQD